MRKLGNLFVIVPFIVIACTAQQMQSIRKVASTAGSVLTAVAQAYGSPYSSLIQTFFDVAGGQEGVTYSDLGTSQEEQVQGEYQADQAEQQAYGRDYQGEGGYQDSSQQSIQQYPTQGQYQSGYGEAQQGTGYYQETYAQQLQVTVDLVREVNVGGRYEAIPVMDGDTLTRRDNYKVMFQSFVPCYIYIAQLDATGKLDPIFPSQFAQQGNPVNANVHYSIPPGNDWFFLDENIGRETIYFIASQTRRSDIETLFRKFEETNANLQQRTPISLHESVIITRGIGGTRKGRAQTVQFQDGSQGQYNSTLISSISADFVMTRWFEHR